MFNVDNSLVHGLMNTNYSINQHAQNIATITSDSSHPQTGKNDNDVDSTEFIQGVSQTDRPQGKPNQHIFSDTTSIERELLEMKQDKQFYNAQAKAYGIVNETGKYLNAIA